MRGLLLVFSLGRAPESTGDRWFGADKVKHFFTSAFVQSASYGTLRGVGAGHGAALAGASVTTAGVGIGKELFDARRGGHPSRKDLAWDAAGAATVSVLLARTAR